MTTQMRWGEEAGLEDPFDDSLVSLMPKTFEGLAEQHPHLDANGLLEIQALNKTEEDTRQANLILTTLSKLDLAEIYSDTAPSCKADYLEEMAQEPELFKENIPPGQNSLNPRVRREGSGRPSTRQPFTINSRSFGSNLNVQKDPRNMENVDEFFEFFERQETAEALLRKMQGQKSPVTSCSQQSFKSRVRRQGTGRRKISKNFDVKLVGSTGKYTQLDEELLEIEEEEVPSTFTGQTGQDCGNLMETDDKKICWSETEETVNMPPENLFSAQGALNRLLKDYMKVDGENKSQASFSTTGVGMCESGKYPKVKQHDIKHTLSQSQTESSDTVHESSKEFSVSGLGMHESGKPYLNDLQYDMQYALPHSQTESSDTIHKQSLCAEEVKRNMQPHQTLRNSVLAGSDRTPFDVFCQKAKETRSPLTSPTPPSKISAAFKLWRKHTCIVEGKSTDACIPPVQNRDGEIAKDHTSFLHSSRKSNLSKKGQVLSNFSSALKSQRKQENSVEAMSGDACIPPTHNRDEELPKYHTNSPSHLLRNSSPLKQGESCGIRRLTFDSPSNSPKNDGYNNAEGLNGVEDSNMVNPLESCDMNEKVQMERTVVIQNVTLPDSEKATEVESTEMSNCNAVASGKETEESPLALHNKHRKKVKRQSKKTANEGDCIVHEEDKTTSNETVSREKRNKRSEYHRRQSLAGAGTLWKSGVRRSTRIRSRPLEYWRGERFLYGRIHNSLTTVIGIKYSSPDPALKKKKDAPRFKVKSYVDDQYSHLVDFAAAY